MSTEVPATPPPAFVAHIRCTLLTASPGGIASVPVSLNQTNLGNKLIVHSAFLAINREDINTVANVKATIETILHQKPEMCSFPVEICLYVDSRRDVKHPSICYVSLHASIPPGENGEP